MESEHLSSASARRIGIARLTKMAFDGVDFAPLWNELLEQVRRDPANASALMDMSCIAQFSGDPNTGASLQSRALVQQVLYRSPCATRTPRLRLLAFAAPTDMGGNTPVEFLLEGSDVELLTLYIAPGLNLPDPLPEHEIAIVTISDSDETAPMLKAIDALKRAWSCSVLNDPEKIRQLDRDKLYKLLSDVASIEIPATGRVSRAELADVAMSDVVLHDVIEDGAYPLVIRPVGSHAGNGLAKIDAPGEIDRYLEERGEEAFFISRYVDYADTDGQFRKYRVVFVDGRPYACHMAVCSEWKVWYLNADMSGSAEKRAEEERFMTAFDQDFGKRHAAALGAIAARIGLEYFAIDCAETKSGRLVLFEADNAAIVHNMDPPDLFPYKAPQMRKVFDAFLAMLYKYAGTKEARAA